MRDWMFANSEGHALVSSIPLVLFILSAILSVIALFIRKGGLNLILFLLVLVGTGCIYFAITTGEAAEKLITLSSHDARELLNAHKRLADKTMLLAIISSGLILLQLIMCWIKAKKLYALLSIVNLALVITCSMLLFQVMKTGVELVYSHGLGVKHKLEKVP